MLLELARSLRIFGLIGVLYAVLAPYVSLAQQHPGTPPEALVVLGGYAAAIPALGWVVVVLVQALLWSRNAHIENKHALVSQQVASLKGLLESVRDERATLLAQRDAERAACAAQLKASVSERELYGELARRFKRAEPTVTVAERDQLVRDVFWLARAVREGLAVVPADVSADVLRLVAPLAAPAHRGATVEAWLSRLAPHALEYNEIAGVVQAWNPSALPAHERQAREGLLVRALLNLEASVAAVSALPPETARSVFEMATRLLWRAPPLALRPGAAEGSSAVA